MYPGLATHVHVEDNIPKKWHEKLAALSSILFMWHLLHQHCLSLSFSDCIWYCLMIVIDITTMPYWPRIMCKNATYREVLFKESEVWFSWTTTFFLVVNITGLCKQFQFWVEHWCNYSNNKNWLSSCCMCVTHFEFATCCLVRQKAVGYLWHLFYFGTGCLACLSTSRNP